MYFYSDAFSAYFTHLPLLYLMYMIIALSIRSVSVASHTNTMERCKMFTMMYVSTTLTKSVENIAEYSGDFVSTAPLSAPE